MGYVRMGWDIQGWGGLCRGRDEWVKQGWGGLCRGGVGYAGVDGSCRGGVGHVGVEWGWVM